MDRIGKYDHKKLIESNENPYVRIFGIIKLNFRAVKICNHRRTQCTGGGIIVMEK